MGVPFNPIFPISNSTTTEFKQTNTKSPFTTNTSISESTSVSQSIHSLWNSINKSVGSALNNLFSLQPSLPSQADFSLGLRPEHAQQSPVKTNAANTLHGRASPTPPRSPSPSLSHTVPRSRSPSPRRDIGFSAAVANLVEQAHTIVAEERRERSSSFRSNKKGRSTWPQTQICSGTFQYSSIMLFSHNMTELYYLFLLGDNSKHYLSNSRHLLFTVECQI